VITARIGKHDACKPRLAAVEHVIVKNSLINLRYDEIV
jgi:hypothetical protein